MGMRSNYICVLSIFLASLISVGLYFLYSAGYFQTGFPLDDAWIHQTYARSLGETGVWTFLPGKPSSGSTSPLWTGLLSLGYILRLKPLFFSSLLGIITLTGCGLLFQRASERFDIKGSRPWFGLFIVFEWHLVWAALSGMETLLFALVILAVLMPLISGEDVHLWQGFLVGFAVWIRPEGITLLAPLLLTIMIQPVGKVTKIKRASIILLSFVLIAAPYLLMNQLLSGSLWPNTFYAKQVEYSELLSQPLLERVGKMVLPFITGAGVLLIPGFMWFCFVSFRQSRWGAAAAILWCIGFVGMYILRMPVTYQHGRYMIPAVPIYLIAGLLGSYSLYALIQQGKAAWFAGRAGIMTLGAILAGFWIMGAGAYSRDVAIIQSEMVKVSNWVSANTPPDSKVAAHDIGAMGYYSGRDILDLAGLINSEVIPFMRDDVKIGKYLDESSVDYLVTFPDWYPLLTQWKSPIYCSDGKYSPGAGGSNMCVYLWSDG